MCDCPEDHGPNCNPKIERGRHCCGHEFHELTKDRLRYYKEDNSMISFDNLARICKDALCANCAIWQRLCKIFGVDSSKYFSHDTSLIPSPYYLGTGTKVDDILANTQLKEASEKANLEYRRTLFNAFMEHNNFDLSDVVKAIPHVNGQEVFQDALTEQLLRELMTGEKDI